MAAEYILFTDSASDILPEKLQEWNVGMMCLGFLFTDDGVEKKDHDQPSHEFYEQMRKGRVAKTTSLNEDVIREAFIPVLEAGKDILYLAFSSGLSVTCENGKKVAAQLAEKYPDRTIRVVDSLCASAGQGLFVYLAVQNRDRGMDVNENADAMENDKLHICHWFTVEDLKYLKRGGRVSGAAAAVGTMLDLKPIIVEAADGTLKAGEKIRGRKKALAYIVDAMLKENPDPAESPIIILNADAPEDAERVKANIESKLPGATILIEHVGPVIGAHAGPGTIAVCFIGRENRKA